MVGSWERGVEGNEHQPAWCLTELTGSQMLIQTWKVCLQKSEQSWCPCVYVVLSSALLLSIFPSEFGIGFFQLLVCESFQLVKANIFLLLWLLSFRSVSLRGNALNQNKHISILRATCSFVMPNWFDPNVFHSGCKFEQFFCIRLSLPVTPAWSHVTLNATSRGRYFHPQ